MSQLLADISSDNLLIGTASRLFRELAHIGVIVAVATEEKNVGQMGPNVVIHIHTIDSLGRIGQLGCCPVHVSHDRHILVQSVLSRRSHGRFVATGSHELDGGKGAKIWETRTGRYTDALEKCALEKPWGAIFL